MKKFLVGLSAVAVLGLGALASCGGGGENNFVDAVRHHGLEPPTTAGRVPFNNTLKKRWMPSIKKANTKSN